MRQPMNQQSTLYINCTCSSYARQNNALLHKCLLQDQQNTHFQRYAPTDAHATSKISHAYLVKAYAGALHAGRPADCCCQTALPCRVAVVAAALLLYCMRVVGPALPAADPGVAGGVKDGK